MRDIPRADGFDVFLMAVFMFGIATGIDLKLGAGLPVPTVIAGGAAAVMLMRRLSLVQERHLLSMLILLLIFVASVLCATGYEMIGERFKGLMQLSYSVVIAYALFLSVTLYDRDQLARIFLIACILIIFGTALEVNSGAFRSISDGFRAQVYSFGIYASDLRDLQLYGRVRPKLFTSEPSAITFAYLLFAFAWYGLSRLPGKVIGFFGLVAVGYITMRGPTLLLALPLAGAYELFLAPRYNGPFPGKLSFGRVVFGVAACGLLAIMFVVAATALYSERIYQIVTRGDASFFFRVIGPTLVTIDSLKDYPLAGIGITGEEFIENRVWQIYFTSQYATLRARANPINSVLTNYFWLHWLYFGLGFGMVVLMGVYAWLKKLGTPSIMFCWIVWLTFGMSSGAYVSPKTWCVLTLAAAIARLHELQPSGRQAPVPQRAMRPGWVLVRRPAG